MKLTTLLSMFFAISTLAFAASISGEQKLKQQCEKLGTKIQYYNLKPSKQYAPNRFIVKGCRVENVLGRYFAILIQNKPTVTYGVQYAGNPEDLKPQTLLLTQVADEDLRNEILTQMGDKAASADKPSNSYIADQVPTEGKYVPSFGLEEESDIKTGSKVTNQSAKQII